MSSSTEFARLDAHLVVVVKKRPLEEHHHALLQGGDAGGEASQGGHRRGAHGGVLQDDAVVNVADVLGGLLGLWALRAQHVQDLGAQVRELAVLRSDGNFEPQTFISQYGAYN